MSNGNNSTSSTDILDTFTDYYKTLYSEKPINLLLAEPLKQIILNSPIKQ